MIGIIPGIFVISVKVKDTQQKGGQEIILLLNSLLLHIRLTDCLCSNTAIQHAEDSVGAESNHSQQSPPYHTNDFHFLTHSLTR
ncbi:hypothetical protein HA41_15995 [Pantoea conspicua]|uniref:Uncharacterized protein n=1 Tax=Pantoea conspicua TaxID=472705 RepID=A0A1X1BSV5_9GAMM|nr:hypothetical protein HA41_15995 [Pantoea conspicua]